MNSARHSEDSTSFRTTHTAVREPFHWSAPASGGDNPALHEQVILADDHEQPTPLTLEVLFEPAPEGIYDVEWIIDAPCDVPATGPLARCYRVPTDSPSRSLHLSHSACWTTAYSAMTGWFVAMRLCAARFRRSRST